ncbi:hypothetical protein CRI94_16650 [Longibacter salinarum]|uniref:Uncharacterized protein n=1 Tax=Longibacter salinarum TaxID=1850348 RepID=A0A2A8CU06_9BACT|nr:hypothetical protein CRI94_16650 [Longibacter salinarum]
MPVRFANGTFENKTGRLEEERFGLGRDHPPLGYDVGENDMTMRRFVEIGFDSCLTQIDNVGGHDRHWKRFVGLRVPENVDSCVSCPFFDRIDLTSEARHLDTIIWIQY